MEHKLDEYKLTVERFIPFLGEELSLNLQTEISENYKNASATKNANKNTIVAQLDKDLFNFIQNYNTEKMIFALQKQEAEKVFKEDKVLLRFQSDDDKEKFLLEVDEFKYEMVMFNPEIFTSQQARQDVKSLISKFNGLPDQQRLVSFVEVYEEGFVKVVGRDVPLFDNACSQLKRCIKTAEEKSNLIKNTMDVLPAQAELLLMSDEFQRLVLVFDLKLNHLLVLCIVKSMKNAYNRAKYVTRITTP